MGELRVHLFGRLRLVYDGFPLTGFKTPRLQALFAHLILNSGKPQFRYQIAFTFWPDSSEEQAHQPKKSDSSLAPSIARQRTIHRV